MTSHRRIRLAATAAALALGAACSSSGGGGLGGLGSILGGVLGQQGGNQLSGTVQGLDTRNQQIGVQQSNGQTVALAYDNNTKVVYQDRVYNVTSLDPGDQIVARVQGQTNGGSYYTDSVVVTQPVNGSTNTGTTSSSGVVQSLQGTVRAVDRNAGVFTMDAGTNVTLTVSLPYNANRNDVTKFQNLRSGDYVRLQGVYLNNARVELRQFY